MNDITGAQLNAITHLQRQTAYVNTLAESVIMGGPANRHEALEHLPTALATLSTRLDAAMVALALHHEVP